MSVAKIKRSYPKFSECIDECVISTARKFAIFVFIALTNISPIVNNCFTLRVQHDNRRSAISS